MSKSSSSRDPVLRRVLAPAVPALTAAAVLAALSGVGQLAAVWCMIRMIGDAGGNWPLLACAAWGASVVISAAGSWLAHGAEARFEARLRRRAAGHILRLPADRLSAYPADRLRRLVSEDVSALHHMIAHLPSELAALVVVPAAAVVLLLVAAGPAALLALVPGLIAAVVYLIVLPKLSKAHGAQRGLVMTEITTAVDDYARGIGVLRANGSGAGALADYTAAADRFTGGMVAWVRRVATPAAVAVGLLRAPASFAIAYAVGVAWDAPRLAAVLLLGLALVTPALRLGHGLDYVAAGRAAAARIGQLLSEPQTSAGRHGPAVTNAVVEVDGAAVSVDDRMLLGAVSFRAEPGQVTVVTGTSGAGKSTLLRAIAGLQPLDDGEIRLGRVVVAEIAEAARGDAVLLVPQGADVLPDSVRENLLLTAPSATDDALRVALDRAEFPVSLDADASALSGGEKQRIGLARAFLTPAPVILLDEPTSALDRETGERFWKNLHGLARDGGRTVVVVTHDPELAALADARVALIAAHDLQGADR